MSNIDEALEIARKEVMNITECDDGQKFMNKCLGTEFIDCTESFKWYERRGRIYDAPKRGDQIFIGDSTGIVELVSGNIVHTIEIDADINSTFFGLLRRKERNVGEGKYGRPTYKSVELIVGLKGDEARQWLAAQNIEIEEWGPVKRGSIGFNAQVVQAALICLGYSCGEYGANGFFNNDSVDAVKRFQKNNKMICNGIVGKAVAMKLFKGMSSSK